MANNTDIKLRSLVSAAKELMQAIEMSSTFDFEQQNMTTHERWAAIKVLWNAINRQVRLKMKALRQKEALDHADNLAQQKHLTDLYNKAHEQLLELSKPLYGLQAGLMALLFSLSLMNKLPSETRVRAGIAGALAGAGVGALGAGYFLSAGLVATFGTMLAASLFSYYFTLHSVAVYQAYRAGTKALNHAINDVLEEESMAAQSEPSKDYLPLHKAFSMKLKFTGTEQKNDLDEEYDDEYKRRCRH